MIESVRTGRPTFQDGIIDSPADVGGWPEYTAALAPADADRDGMPDAWETRHGLDPHDRSDAAKDADGDGYTAIEEYLNGTDPAVFVDYTKPENNRDTLHSPAAGRGRDDEPGFPGFARLATVEWRGDRCGGETLRFVDRTRRGVVYEQRARQPRPRLLALRLSGRRRDDPRRPGAGGGRSSGGDDGRRSRPPSTRWHIWPRRLARNPWRGVCSGQARGRGSAWIGAGGSYPGEGDGPGGTVVVARGTDRRTFIPIQGRDDRRVVLATPV